MDHREFTKTLDLAAELIQRSFTDWETPAFFLQFSVGFDLDGLFDAPPQQLSSEILPLMPEHHTPDRHLPVFLYGRCRGIPLLVSHGHRHLFEGLGPLPCIAPTCLAWRLGIPRFLYADPVLSLNPELKVGSWTLLTDFINGHHISPLDGLLPLLDNPFTDMSCALSQRLNSGLVNAFSQVSIFPRLCVYQALPGAHFCTPAEARAARTAHVDLVGHDLVMEIITAHALGRQVAALALVAEMAPAEEARTLHRHTILENCRYCSDTLLRGLKLAITEIIDDDNAPVAAQLPESSADELLSRDIHRPSGREPVLRKYLRR